MADHAWARGYVEQGIYDTRAAEVGSTQEILALLEGERSAVTLAV